MLKSLLCPEGTPFSILEEELKKKNFPIAVSGLGEIHKAHLLATMHASRGGPMVLLVSDKREAVRQGENITAFFGKKPILLENTDIAFHPVSGMSKEKQGEKVRALYQIARSKAPIVILTPLALMQKTLAKDLLLQHTKTLKLGQKTNLDQLANDLVSMAYVRVDQVEGRGQFALRGGILDLFSPGEESPVRMEFFGDEIDSMAYFDPLSQRRGAQIKQAKILPREENIAQGQRGPLFDYLPKDATLLISEYSKVKAQALAYEKEQEETIAHGVDAGRIQGGFSDFFLSWQEVEKTLGQEETILLDQFTSSRYGDVFSPRGMVPILAKELPSYAGSLETAQGDIEHYKEAGYQTLVFCKTPERAKRLSQWLEGKEISHSLDLAANASLPDFGACKILVGSLPGGFEYPGIKLAVITEGQILKQDFSRKKKKSGKALERYTDLSPGDLVVHEHHGIGRFISIVPMDIDGMKKDYIKIAYHGTDALYLPVTQLDLVAKYIGTGGEDRPVKLSRMGGVEWTRARQKAKGAARDLARELIALYATRQRQKGHAFMPDTAWQNEFEEKFEYAETDDQLQAAREIKKDMEKSIPMDRLLCGDVGYGKTEVALRAIMKCVMEGKQAAVLVPTTVLAQQHFQTAQRRFLGYPIGIEVLSRYKTAAQAKKVEKALAEGQVDILIGTHKILQKSLKFKDLGLLVVDEEQRFGVSHKERLKEIAQQVDVLTLSATPIPRTLNMALSGIRDMSTIEEPPQNRRPVQTYVLEHDWGVVCEAIKREIARGGQVYYLHNRVETIEGTAAKIREMIPGVNIALGHGKMDEKHLSYAMEQMINRQADILVCTTIIETGIDIPNVNTLIIENADHMGLAQLHQIRGRVGRSNRSAYAYLTYRPGKILTEVASKRLAAIHEFVEFNSGFKIALRDLEIRGAGNLLGREQSGHMVSVGYDMYLKLLNEAVLEEKGEALPRPVECAADLSIDANIPASYVPMPEQRMELYRRIAQVKEAQDAEDVIDELIDRFGDPPKSVLALIDVAKLRGLAAQGGITEIVQKGNRLLFTFLPEEFALEKVSEIYNLQDKAGLVKILAGDVPKIQLKIKEEKKGLEQAQAFVKLWAAGQV